MPPVILVPGYDDGSQDKHAYMAEWEALMVSHGHDARGLVLPGNDNPTNAWALAYKANSIAGKVDVVAHSMGCIASRYYLKWLSGHLKVRRMVFVGATHDGWLVNLYGLNQGDDTPGAVQYFDIYGPEDGYAPLDGGGTVATYLDVPHTGQPFNPLVVARVNEILVA